MLLQSAACIIHFEEIRSSTWCLSLWKKPHILLSVHAHTHTHAQQMHKRAWQEVQLSEKNKQPLHRKKAGQKIKRACMFPQGVYVCVCVCTCEPWWRYATQRSEGQTAAEAFSQWKCHPKISDTRWRWPTRVSSGHCDDTQCANTSRCCSFVISV